MNGAIQMKGCSESFYHLRSKFGIHGIHLTGLSRGKMNNVKRYNRYEKEGNCLFDYTFK